MLITAKFASVCRTCSKPIIIGDRVSWVRGSSAVHAACSEEGRAVVAAVNASKAPELAPESAAALDLPCPEGRDYLPYQRAGIAYALARQGTLIADEMGLGKTVQAIGVINASPDVARVLIVCPASLKLNWRNELRRWLTRPLSIGDIAKPADITIVNYDILKKLPADYSCDLLILDEAHYCKNPKAARTKLTQALARRAKRIIALTGTPILNKPVELFPLLQMVAPREWDAGGNGFFRFAIRYCNAHKEQVSRTKSVWTFDGSSNLTELQEKLRTTCMVRRLKTDVLKDLPPKRRQVVTIGNGCRDEEEYGPLGEDYETAYAAMKKIPFENLSRTRHAQALRKVEAAIEHISNAIEASGKVVVFAHHKDVVAQLADRLSSFGAVTLTGDTPNEARQSAVERFQGDETCRVFIGSIAAAGVGLTLTRASHVIFVELDWVPANLTQAEDRCHRIGQTESVLVQHLVLDGSLDAKMARLITEKQDVADMALDTDAYDVSGRAVVNVESEEAKRARKLAEAAITEAECASIHARLKFLASRCDGAVEEDGVGYNGLDTNFGKQLAAQAVLSPKQALAARKMLVKYKRQLAGMV